jgi:hypothetical protein
VNLTRKWPLGPGVELWAGDKGELIIVAKGGIAVELSGSVEELRVAVAALAGAFRSLAGLPRLTAPREALGGWSRARSVRFSGGVVLVQTADELWLLGQRPTALSARSSQAFIDAVFELEAGLGSKLDEGGSA